MKMFFRFMMAALISMTASFASEAAEFPSHWRKTMTANPDTNHYLAEAMKPLPDADAEILRIVKLVAMLASLCDGAKINQKVANTLSRSFYKLDVTEKRFKEAHFLAHSRFNYFDYRQLAHLCAGADYMFGKEGRLATGLLTTGGKGEPKRSFNPNAPFLHAPAFALKGKTLAIEAK